MITFLKLCKNRKVSLIGKLPRVLQALVFGHWDVGAIAPVVFISGVSFTGLGLKNGKPERAKNTNGKLFWPINFPFHLVRTVVFTGCQVTVILAGSQVKRLFPAV